MTRSTIDLDPTIAGFVRQVNGPEHPALAALRARTDALPEADYQIAVEQGQFMAWLVRLIDARSCLEIGTFTGYSALACALALPEDGRLVTLDANAEWTAIARRAWAEAGVAERIELRLGQARDSLRALRDEGRDDSFDFAFIDADKGAYPAYVEQVLALVRPGALILLDNMLWHGTVADPHASDKQARTLRALLEDLQSDARVDHVLLPIADGVSLLRKL